MKNQADAMIIVLAWPDVFVLGVGGFYDPIFKGLGINNDGKYKAGHAALVLVNRKTGSCEFFDFGRYITPDGKGRVRGANTDPEVAIPIKATIQANRILNLKEILIWLEANKAMTHGKGRMIASVCYEINYNAAKTFIVKEQAKGSWRYSAFHPIATNCSRFVADACSAGGVTSWVKVKNTIRLTLTPSPLGNVYNSGSYQGMLHVQNGHISEYPTCLRTVLKDVILGFTDKPPAKLNSNSLTGTVKEPTRPSFLNDSATWLGGKGAGVWFQHKPDPSLQNDLISIQRIGPTGIVDFERIYKQPSGFNKNKTFRFIYDCNARYCTVLQGGRRHRLDVINENQGSITAGGR